MTDGATRMFDNRITRSLGVEIPIVQAPMGWIARSQLASAVSNAGGLGIIETSSGELDAIREEIRKMKAVDAGVDGLIVEGGEGGGFKNPDPVASMVLLPLVRSKVDVPIVAAGGMLDGRTMAAAFALGAEAIQMGTRMVSALESPVHDNWKKSITAAAETDTVFFNQRHSPALRAIKTDRTVGLQFAEHNVFGDFGDAQELYFGGDMEAAVPLGGQVMGRIDDIRPVSDIIAECGEEFFAIMDGLATDYLKGDA